jgi:hypothetical protein
MQLGIDSDSGEIKINSLRFFKVQLLFGPDTKVNLFALKNNKTVGETISESKYKFLSDIVKTRYSESVNNALGEFLLGRKLAGDKFYLRFLNRYGDETYCRFYFQDSYLLTRMGLYFYVVDKKIVYVGQSRDSFEKRINHGYGNISPKNCYLDGQATNCHLNSLITGCKTEVKLYLCELKDMAILGHLERDLIQNFRPDWNNALK